MDLKCIMFYNMGQTVSKGKLSGILKSNSIDHTLESLTYTFKSSDDKLIYGWAPKLKSRCSRHLGMDIPFPTTQINKFLNFTTNDTLTMDEPNLEDICNVAEIADWFDYITVNNITDDRYDVIYSFAKSIGYLPMDAEMQIYPRDQSWWEWDITENFIKYLDGRLLTWREVYLFTNSCIN